MPLYRCRRCNVVENTALGTYWHDKRHSLPVLCSECGKDKWHGQFPRRTPEELGLVEYNDGFLWHPVDNAEFIKRDRLKPARV
jgi:hypothetical protein